MPLSKEDEEDILWAWFGDDHSSYTQFNHGTGTRLLNIVGPAYSGKSTAVPTLFCSLGGKNTVYFYAVRTSLDAKRLQHDCSSTWTTLADEPSPQVKIVTYSELERDLPSTLKEHEVFVFIDVDPDASLEYVMCWATLAICAPRDAVGKLRIVAISETELPTWQKNIMTTLSHLNADSISVAHAPPMQSVDPRPYISGPGDVIHRTDWPCVDAKERDLTQSLMHKRARDDDARVRHHNDSQDKYLGDFLFSTFSEHREVMLFVGEQHTLDEWITARIARTTVKPDVQIIDEDTTWDTVQDIAATVEKASTHRHIVAIHPAVRISRHQAARFNFTHVYIHGYDTRGIHFSPVTGNFADWHNKSERSPGPGQWLIHRTLAMINQDRPLPVAAVFCMEGRPPSDAIKKAGLHERQFYRQRDLYAFVLRSIELTSRHGVVYSTFLKAVFSPTGEIDGRYFVELLERLRTAGFACSAPNKIGAIVSPLPRAQSICSWLPVVKNNMAAAWILASPHLKNTGIEQRRLLIAMAVIICYGDRPFVTLSPEAALEPEVLLQPLDAFFKPRGDSIIPMRGYVWLALTAWIDVVGEGDFLPGKDALPYANGHLKVDLKILTDMYALFCHIAERLGIHLDKNGRHPVHQPSRTRYQMLQNELLGANFHRLHFVSGIPGSKWGTRSTQAGQEDQRMHLDGPFATVWDMVSERRVAASQGCRVFLLDSILGPTCGGFYAVSVTPTMLADRKYQVTDLTFIETEVINLWRDKKKRDDSDVPWENPRPVDEQVRSRYPRSGIVKDGLEDGVDY